MQSPARKATIDRQRKQAKRDKTAALLLWAKIVKAGGRCEKCGRAVVLDAHHVVRKSQSGLLSTDLQNGLALCKKEHMWWHSNELEAGVWFVETFGRERYDYLTDQRRLVGVKVDWAARRVELTEHAKQLGLL